MIDADLLQEEKQGFGMPNRIYLSKLSDQFILNKIKEEKNQESRKANLSRFGNLSSDGLQNKHFEAAKTAPNKTNKNKTYVNKNKTYINKNKTYINKIKSNQTIESTTKSTKIEDERGDKNSYKREKIYQVLKT